MTDSDAPAPRPLADTARLLAEAARLEANSLGHTFVGVEHILLALLADPGLAEAAANRGVPAREELRRRLASVEAPRGVGGGGEFALSPQARRMIEGAEPLNRSALLDRILGNPRGPLVRLLSAPPAESREPRVHSSEKGRESRVATRAPGREPRATGREKKPEPKPSRDSQPAAREAAPVATRESARPPVSPPARASWLRPRTFLLLLVPGTVALNLLHAHPLLLFGVSCLGVVPLASIMGEATEHLASRAGPAIGGLLNATFGNAAELIIAIVALRAGLIDLVKASITGSILGNLLLIMGLCFVAGGLRQQTLRYNKSAAATSAGMLALAVVGLIFPALFHHLHPEAAPSREQLLSESVAAVLAVIYILSLVFSLRTHRSLFGGDPHPVEGEIWGPLKATLFLALATAGVVVQSEILVHATEQVTATMKLSQTFLGLIIIPIIGNAAEHGTAVIVARKGQMDLALQIALGSSTQVALLVAPLLVLVGTLLGTPMDLAFSTFEILAVGLTVLVTAIITLDGESNWFEGAQLLAMYALVGAMAFFV